MPITNDFITSTDWEVLGENNIYTGNSIMTNPASTDVFREKVVADPDFTVLVNKDLVGDRTLLSQDAQSVIYNGDAEYKTEIEYKYTAVSADDLAVEGTNPKNNGWYEEGESEGTYVPTEDETVTEQKNYYIQEIVD